MTHINYLLHDLAETLIGLAVVVGLLLILPFSAVRQALGRRPKGRRSSG